jgi:Rrf2 family protein
MRLTTMSRFGTRAIFDIAYHSLGMPVSVKDVSERQEIPSKYLEQIFHKLKKIGIVKGTRGPSGGYVLAQDPGKITVGDIIRAVQEQTSLVHCVDPEAEGYESCPREGQCVTRLLWKEAGRKAMDLFDSVTISDLCEKAGKMNVKRDVRHSYDYSI